MKKNYNDGKIQTDRGIREVSVSLEHEIIHLLRNTLARYVPVKICGEKAPPKNARAPVPGRSCKPGPACKTFESKNEYHTKMKNNNIMKKQRLIVLAAFLTVNAALGQVPPRPLNCSDDPTHPIVGRPYTYTADSDPSGIYTFWATKHQNFITTTNGVTTSNLAGMLTLPLEDYSENYGVPDPRNNVQIIWSDAIVLETMDGSPTFVVVNHEGSCANNLKVWALQPINAFTVDILNLDNVTRAPIGTGLTVYDAAASQCFDQVRRAVYNPSTSSMQYDFGTNVLYFEIVAANFTTSWTPTFTLSGLGNGQTAVIEWAYDNTFTSPVTVTSGIPSSTIVTTTQENTSTGVPIFVRVTVNNNTYEGTTPTTIRLAVDGQNSVGSWDVINATCAVTTGADQNDYSDQTLNPRPTLTPVAPATFVPGNQTN